jgi:hypothetical protein
MGRAWVSNAICNEPCPATESALELLRLVPYWTARAGRRMGGLSNEAELASFADERLDDSGFFGVPPARGSVSKLACWLLLRST